MPLNVRPIDPLNHNVPIVDELGRPTQYFARQWTLSRTINLTTDDLTISIADLQQLLTTLQGLAASLQLALDDLGDTVGAGEARQIIAGVGLSGGGDLTADRTINLEDTAVVPDTYGDATHIPQITVDQQGRITGVVNIAI